MHPHRMLKKAVESFKLSAPLLNRILRIAAEQLSHLQEVHVEPEGLLVDGHEVKALCACTFLARLALVSQVAFSALLQELQQRLHFGSRAWPEAARGYT